MHQSEVREHSPTRDLSLYERYAPVLLDFLCRHLTSREDAEDLLVEVLLAALDKPDFALLTAEHQRAWLHRVASNKMIDLLRRRSRQMQFSLDNIVDLESDELTPEQHSIHQESYVHLHQLIARLSPEQQELIRLRYGEGLRLVDIAERLHRPDGSVRAFLARTLRRLRTLYAEFENEKES